MALFWFFLLAALTTTITASPTWSNFWPSALNNEVFKTSYHEFLENRALQNFINDNLRLLNNEVQVPDRIVGGVDAEPGDAPFQIQLFRRSFFSSQFLCGGSLITPRTVLTAGHCVSNSFSYRIRYGSNSRLQSPYADAEVSSIRRHPKYDTYTIQNDLALFILKKAIEPSSNVAIINLETQITEPKTNVTLYGFGLTNGKDRAPSEKLQKTTLATLSDSECTQHVAKLGVTKSPGMICARADKRSACNGDSGGPLVNTQSHSQVGIVSFGTRFCPPGSVNVYTNVSYYIDWINRNKV